MSNVLDVFPARGADLRFTTPGAPMLLDHLKPSLFEAPPFAWSTVTSASYPAPERRPIPQTTTGAPALATEAAGSAIGELRRVSGLTWEQLASLFGVSRRALHFWASGKAMNAAHEELLQRVLAVVRRLDRGSASANRALLLAAQPDGSRPLDLLATRDFARLVQLEAGLASRGGVPQLSVQARKDRAPPPPEELIVTSHDRVHPVSGRLLGATPIAAAKRK